MLNQLCARVFFFSLNDDVAFMLDQIHEIGVSFQWFLSVNFSAAFFFTSNLNLLTSSFNCERYAYYDVHNDVDSASRTRNLRAATISNYRITGNTTRSSYILAAADVIKFK